MIDGLEQFVYFVMIDCELTFYIPITTLWQVRLTLIICDSSGEVINPKDRCKKCQGKKVCKESKILEVSWILLQVCTVHAHPYILI